ncbi:hypothetical protein WA588_004381, partial [Blastocystis sp. NMH]
MKAYRAAKREGYVEARVKEAFGSQETSVLAAMSAVEEDAFLADLVRLLAEDAHTLLTQNVMYLFKYFNSNPAVGPLTEAAIRRYKDRLVPLFGTGFILKKNLLAFATAGFGASWKECVREVEALVPNHFKQTFDEIYEQIDMKTEVRSVIRQPLLDACLQESV